ncbi:nucleotide sugar dehydrogenase [Kaistia dalseonensis]|uniref:UDP-glucose 6-dehydrogenase n=1 Tax=Kaistia dalseonensis TaxID=410840 RepID=A0ABU0H206_9HYPH|nr:nucleotide sugar dehydrogenase [Kaistia dalseonensis]MCX5493780.1 nucleotide sugar dehydrogenase [Kaistia dalseonensis]MDQ0436344.1 GDP-mannose 6-dehydrogenase [Kaistia dalseonensis]
MKIGILGLGYVGLTAAGCLIKEGHTIVGVEPNEDKIRTINSGKSPIYEPGLDELLALGIAEGRLILTQRIENQLDDCDIAMICVGTPSGADGSHNMSYIAEVTRQIASQLDTSRAKPLTVAFRSTFRPGTIEELITPIFKTFLKDKIGAVELVYNPEFLRESVAIRDYFNPPKIVIGTHDGLPSANMDELYKNLTAPVFYTQFREAEVTKFVDNSFHAVKVTFANEIGRVCAKLGISAKKVHEIFISDTKLNISPYYLRPGGPFGGSCLPKDVRALSYISEDVGGYAFLIDSLLKSNEAHKRFLFEHSTKGLKPGAKVLMLGLAFKPDSDDLRESPNLDMARKLLTEGFDLDIYDPAIDPTKMTGANLGYTYMNLPSISDLLVDKDTAEAGTYDVVIDTNGRAKQLTLASTNIVDVSAIQ